MHRTLTAIVLCLLVGSGLPSGASPASPTVAWAQPARILLSTPLGQDQLNATADVPGTFTYQPSAGTVLPVGIHNVLATFTPDDLGNYSVVVSAMHVEVAYWTETSHPLSLGLDPAIGVLPVVDVGSGRLYVSAGSGVRIFDGVTRVEVGSIAVTGGLGRIAIDAEQRRLFVNNSSGLWVHDISQSPPVLADVPNNPIPTSSLPFDIEVNPRTHFVYATNASGTQVIDPASPANLVATIPQGGIEIEFNPDLNLVYLSRPGGGIAVYEGDPSRGSLHSLLGTMEGIGTIAPNIALNRQQNEVYAVEFIANRLAVYDASDVGIGRQPVATMTFLGLSPRFISDVAVNDNTNTIYVKSDDESGAFDGTAVITAVDAATRTVLSQTPLTFGFHNTGFTGPGLTIDAAHSTIYASSWITDVMTDHLDVTLPLGGGAPVAVGGITMDFPPEMGGTVTVTGIDPGLLPSAPGQFVLQGALAFEISTSQPLTAPVTLCFNASSIGDEDLFNALAVLHYVNGVPIEELVTERDFQSGSICVTVTSLSPFVLARREQSYEVAALFDTTKSFKAGSTVPIKVRALDEVGNNVSSANTPIRLAGLHRTSSSASAAIQDAGHANPDTAFRYSEELGGYIFNMRTKGLAAGSYDLGVKVAGDRRTHLVRLQIR